MRPDIFDLSRKAIYSFQDLPAADWRVERSNPKRKKDENDRHLTGPTYFVFGRDCGQLSSHWDRQWTP